MIKTALSSRPHLFAWYRVAPLMLTAFFGVCAWIYSFAPAPLLSWMYPLEFEDYIAAASSRYDVDPFLVAAVIEAESNWDASAESGRGAQGLMQVMPTTAYDMVELGFVDGEAFSPDSLFDPRTNIEYGCAYLSYLLDYFDGSLERAIAAYNGGMGNVDDWSDDGTALHNAITFPETQAYLIRVTNAHMRYRELYGEHFVPVGSSSDEPVS